MRGFLFLVVGVLTLGCNADKNVLFLAVDDLRPSLGAFGVPGTNDPKMVTPNLDALAAKSLVLKKAQVGQAVCSPSRTCLLTSRHPPTTEIYDLYSYWRSVTDGSGKNITTIPQWFREHGYLTVGMGKIFHPGHASGYTPQCHTCGDDQAYSWSLPYFHAPNLGYWSGTVPKDDRYRGGDSWAFVPEDIEAAHPLPDNQTLEHAIDTLKQLKTNGTKKWMLAVGFHKPHLPFVVPEYFSSFYPADELSLPLNNFPPSNMPPVAWSSFGETRSYADQAVLNRTGAPGTSLPNWDILDLRRAYYSAVTYTDSLIGRLLAALKELDMEQDTIISFWGDHGWKLGAHSNFDKHTNWNIDVHAPMMVHDPELNAKGGVITEQFTEFVDLFPTLAELATGAKIELCPEDSRHTPVCTEGTSLVPLFTAPDKPVRQSTFTVYPRGYQKTPFQPNDTSTFEASSFRQDHDDAVSTASPSACLTKTCSMGWSILTTYKGVEYRFNLWTDFELATPDWSRVVGIELYDHAADPEENVNKAYDTDAQAIVDELTARVKAGWRASLNNA